MVRLKEVGRFRELSAGPSTDRPSLREAIGGLEEDPLLVARYLDGGAVYVVADRPPLEDVLSRDRAVIGDADLSMQTDGVHWWRSDLAYYVRTYKVALPHAFLAHCRELGWRTPRLNEQDLIRICDQELGAQLPPHEVPEDADVLIHADLEEPTREELWVREVGPSTFVMLSIPFFVEGIAVGDVVQTKAPGYKFEKVIRPSGHRVLRVLAQQLSMSELDQELEPLLRRFGLRHEWWAPGGVVIDVAPESDVKELLDWLEARREEGKLEFRFT